MTKELTPTQELFLADLTKAKVICMSMFQLQLKYSKIASKASIKRSIDELVDKGIVKRYHNVVMHNGKISSTTIYRL